MSTKPTLLSKKIIIGLVILLTEELVPEPDPKRFAEFLLKLAEDHDLVKEYKANPETVLKNNNIAQPEKDALKSGDIIELRRMLPEDDVAIVAVVAAFVTR